MASGTSSGTYACSLLPNQMRLGSSPRPCSFGSPLPLTVLQLTSYLIFQQPARAHSSGAPIYTPDRSGSYEDFQGGAPPRCDFSARLTLMLGLPAAGLLSGAC